MNRRNFVIGLGALSAGGAATVGSGAFSTADVNRDVTIETAGDDDALLALRPEDDEFAELDADGNLALSFDENSEDGEGVSPDSTYFFPDVFSVENQGTQEVDDVQQVFEGGDDVAFVIGRSDPDPDLPPFPSSSPPPEDLPGPIELRISVTSGLEPGESETFGVFISVGEDADFGDEEQAITIEAVQDE